MTQGLHQRDDRRENGKGETNHERGSLKNSKRKQSEDFLPPLTRLLGRVFNALEGLRKEESLSYWHQEYYPGVLITGKVKRSPSSLSDSGSPLPVMSLLTGQKDKHMAFKLFLLVKDANSCGLKDK